MRVRWIFAPIVGVLLVAVAVIAVARWSPTVPDDAAASPVFQVLLTNEPNEGCFPLSNPPTGLMDICWKASRDEADADPDKDYYVLRVYGVVGPGPFGGSPRWAVLKAQLEDRPADDVVREWPSGEFGGGCQPVAVTVIPLRSEGYDTLCGRTVATDPGDWTHALTWTCQGCLLPDDQKRTLSLWEWVGVAEGALPSWQIYADFGS